LADLAKNSILIVAGEASSAAYASRLILEFKKQNIDVDFFGVGTQEMEKLGFQRVAKAEDIAVVGLTEVFQSIGKILKAMKQVVLSAKKKKPKAAILMDLPDFNFRIGPKLKKIGIPVVYYISPQVWAWRQNRVYAMKKWVDKILVLFRFEEEFYKERGVDAEFVGHPLLEELTPDLYSGEALMERRQRFGLAEDRLVVGLMPGSRKGEIRHHLESQLQAVNLLKKKHSNIEVVLLVAPTFDTEWLKAQLPELSFNLKLIQKSPYEMISVCDVALVASGTATLMVGLLEKPMVIMYKASPLTVWVALNFIMKKPALFGLSNIILGKMVSKELFQNEANPQKYLRRVVSTCRI
jgi:lipid-A-disaccharide synthase